ncbi:hypothetical protein D5400_19205 [Georhizobium profundi]|jgi:hypothetical protein|uniref:Uncharacterized protein n=1 Tax=Georhizobium profundi TaxID=2341112 RepID=A0A3S9B854_9HYPH|nr:hypothetical protein [Georhizobium profundi]AZN73135.1 hypothetical protein D5400_19205 [Georhizobium profundi]
MRPSFLPRLAGLIVLTGLAAGCSSGGGYAGYTEYRVAPVKTELEIRQEQAEARQRSSTNRGRIVDTGGTGILFGK